MRLQWQLQGHCRLEGLWEAWTAVSCACEMLRGGSLCQVEARGQQAPSWNIQLEGKPALPTALGIAGCWGPSHSPLPTHCRPASSWHHVQNSNILKAVLVGFSREQCLQQLQRVACDYGSPLHSEYSWQTLQRTWMQVWPGKAQLSSRYLDKKPDLKSLSKRKTQNTCGYPPSDNIHILFFSLSSDVLFLQKGFQHKDKSDPDITVWYSASWKEAFC